MKTILTATFVALMSSAAFAEQPAAWPREPIPGDHGYARAVKTAPAAGPSWTADSQSYANWKQLPAASDAGGQFPTPQAELDAQRLRHRAYRIQRHSAIVEAGFCNAAALPVEYVAFCWGALYGPNPSGGPVGAGIN